MKELMEYDVLEIIDMPEKKMKHYSKKELINFIMDQAEIIHELELEVGCLKYGII